MLLIFPIRITCCSFLQDAIAHRVGFCHKCHNYPLCQQRERTLNTDGQIDLKNGTRVRAAENPRGADTYYLKVGMRPYVRSTSNQEARERKAQAFFVGSARKRSLLIGTDRTGVGVTVCVIQFVFRNVCPPRLTHTAPMPVPTGSVHARQLAKPSPEGVALSRSKLIE